MIYERRNNGIVKYNNFFTFTFNWMAHAPTPVAVAATSSSNYTLPASYAILPLESYLI